MNKPNATVCLSEPSLIALNVTLEGKKRHRRDIYVQSYIKDTKENLRDGQCPALGIQFKNALVRFV